MTLDRIGIQLSELNSWNSLLYQRYAFCLAYCLSIVSFPSAIESLEGRYAPIILNYMDVKRSILGRFQVAQLL